jgi:hypothetical protein
MRRSFVPILLFAFPWVVGGQPAVPSLAPPPNRFLFVVDACDSAPGRFDGALMAVRDLLDSGMGGKAQEGDSVGLWTFNEATAASHFPLQHWSASEKHAISTLALAYLQAHKSQTRTGIEKVLPAMNRVMDDSAYITVILVSDGTETIHGTPFDHAINGIYKKWRKEQQKARRPFVTVLQGKYGQFTGYSVTPAPWAVEMPALPPELSRRNLRQELPVAAVPEKMQPAARDMATPVVPTPPRDKAQPPATDGAGPPLAPGIVSSTVLPPEEPAPTLAAPAEADTHANTVQPAAPTPENSSPLPLPPKQEVVQSTIAAPAIQLIPQPAPAPKARAPSTPPPEVSKPAPSPAAHSLPEVATPATAAPKPALRPLEAPRATAAQESVATVPPATLFKRKELWISAVVFVGATLGLAILLVRRSRTADHVSLITRSLEREKDK